MSKRKLLENVEALRKEVEEVALDLWHHPELSGQEDRSANLYRQKFLNAGFDIVDIPKMPHAFYAEYGSGSPVIGFLAEFDALPALSQKVSTSKESIREDDVGHGCGHNLLGAAPYGAALALKELIDAGHLKGTIRFYACPEEETLVGKVKMVHQGAFEDCDISLAWHPMNQNSAVYDSMLANNSIKYYFHGKTSHAAAAPEEGRSALDAVELMNVGANYLREHVIQEARIHYQIINGGSAPNVVPHEAAVWYYVRAPHRYQVEEITARLDKIAEGAALMTGTTYTREFLGGCYEVLGNDVLFDLTHTNLEEIEPPIFTDEEIDLAKSLAISANPAQENNKEFNGMAKGVFAKEDAKKFFIGASSDIGDVSWNMPMNMFVTTTWPQGVPAHTWQATAASGSKLGLKGMMYAAKIIVGVTYDLMTQPDLVEQAKVNFKKRTEDQAYVSPYEGQDEVLQGERI